MESIEKIKVYIKTELGKTICMCCVTNKKCRSSTCDIDVVTRDKYEGWRDYFYRDKYGE